jgi:uncharacterized tellurite resistance protein B-like protein
MFNSLKHWLATLDNKSQLFEHIESEVIHVALASLLYHIIKADSVENHLEIAQFKIIMANEFALSEEQVMLLYVHVKNLKSDLKSDLLTVNNYLKQNPNLRMFFMSKLNQLIGVDGVDNEEITIFYQAMKVVFPDITKQSIGR